MNLSKFIPISVLLASMVSFAGPVSHFEKSSLVVETYVEKRQERVFLSN